MIKLIPKWRQAWRMFSVQALVAVGIIQSVWLSIDDATKAGLPADWVAGITLFLAVFGGIGRLIDQTGGQS